MTSPGDKPSWEVMPSSYAKWQGGYSIDLGAGLSVAPSSSRPLTAPPTASPLAGGQAVQTHGPAVGAPVPSLEPANRGRWSLLCLPMYPWMLAIGTLAYGFVSAPRTMAPAGLHLHFALGIIAAVGAIWLYRLLMAFLPTALLLTLPSALLCGAVAWSASDGRSFRRFATSVNWRASDAADWWSTVRSHAPIENALVLLAVALAVIAHLAYWWHRRYDVRQSRRTLSASGSANGRGGR